MDLKVGARTTVLRKPGPHTQRRFTKHFKPGHPTIIAPDHPASVEGRSIYQKNPHGDRLTGSLLKSGQNQRKLGAWVIKGRWKGFPIFSLTLEERATCPRSCAQWFNCYGNHLHFAVRHKHGVELMSRLIDELSVLQKKYPRGFLIRLHVLGDFYSVDYITFWAMCLNTFPALHVFGYTARTLDDEIGRALNVLIKRRWDRFAIRSSGGGLPDIPAAVVIKSDDERGDAVICPAQKSTNPDNVCCASCNFCWNSKRAVAFLEH
jgi:Gene product 88